MGIDPHNYHRHSLRLKGYDYSKAGLYFITICIQGRLGLFGNIINGQMDLNGAGEMVNKIWEDMPNYYNGMDVLEHQIMPDHIHGIIQIKSLPKGQPQGVAPTIALPDVVHRFKTLTTKLYIDGVKIEKWQRFIKKLWQRNYYDHIIRDEKELKNIRQYISDNPQNWGKT